MPFPSFSDFFRALWSHDPFPWQRMLAERLVEGEWPKALDLPTAAGKTACLDVAIYALAAQAERPVWDRTAPRRIWFVVDRRIVVDEAFERAQKIAAQLREATADPLKTVADRLREVSGTGRCLAVARLRGGVLREDGWARLPSQPAVITSTVDQIGSRLLFRGYGRSALTAPIFAGLAAHDSLILLDEAHLSLPFLKTLRAVERYRGTDWAEQPIRTPFAFSILSATPHPDICEGGVFPGPDRDAALDHPELRRRIQASKLAELVLVKVGRSLGKDPLVDAAVERATVFSKEAGRQRVAVIVNRVRTAESIAKALRERHGERIDVGLLTGRLRPFERDRFVDRWKPVLRANDPDEPGKPVVLVTTQCIEVGADFSFDALVSEAASLDALRQRFGRLNRLGSAESAPAAILVREEDIKAGADDFIYGSALAKCWGLLQELGETRADSKRESKIIDFGIAALDASLRTVDDLAPYLAPAPAAPLLLPSHLDLLCQTSPRPQVEPHVPFYLHGLDRGVPEVRVVWRTDLDENDTDNWPEIVAMCPPSSAEAVAVSLYRVRRWLAQVPSADDSGDVEGALDSEQQARELIRSALVWQGRDRSRVCAVASELGPNDLVVVPTSYGIEGVAQSEPDEVLGEAQLDIWEPSHEQSGKPAALRLHRGVLKPWLKWPPLESLIALAEDPAWERRSIQEAIDTLLACSQEEDNESPTLPDWLLTLLDRVRSGHYEQHPTGGLVLFARKGDSKEEAEQDLFADDDDLLSATGQSVSLDIHSASVERAVGKLVGLCLSDDFCAPLKSAAYWHDAGKLDERFQLMLRQGDELGMGEEPLAKSAQVPDSPSRRRAIRAASGLPQIFRHEMLSLQLATCSLQTDDNVELEDLLLHTIASHHGYGRPFAPVSLDPQPPAVRGVHAGLTIDVSSEDRIGWPAPHSLASGVSERFWRLTRRYGWWGLAYLEAILRLGDWYGSRWVIDKLAEEPVGMPKSPARIAGTTGQAVTVAGIDGANPLGFLAAVGMLAVLHQAGHRESRLAWRRNGLAWCPQLIGLPTLDQELSEMLEKHLRRQSGSEESDKKRKEAEQQFSQKKKEIKDKRDEIKKRRLRGKERKSALDEEVVPLEHELEYLRKSWLDTLRQSVPRPELALGKNIDCTELEYRAIVEPLLERACFQDRESLDMLAAFCSVGCLHESPAKRKAGKLAPTPFSFISGSGHQNFLDTASDLLGCVSSARLQSVLFEPWGYEDEGLSMRWDPIEDRRYALMDRDPTASDNKPRTVWMANLLAYRALVLFPSAPVRDGLATVGWVQEGEGEPFFTWPLWVEPVGLDSIRSLLLLPELYHAAPDADGRDSLRARGVTAVFRSRRIKVGTGANFKVNFSPARAV